MNLTTLASRIAIVSTLGVVFLAPVCPAQETETALGEPMRSVTTVPIARLLSHPDTYLGRIVRVAGLVTKVGPSNGSWIELADTDDRDKVIRVEVEEGLIAFPRDARGRRAEVEGVLTKTVLTLEQTVAHLQDGAEEQGKDFDAESVTEPLVFYRIEGSGAVIREGERP